MRWNGKSEHKKMLKSISKFQFGSKLPQALSSLFEISPEMQIILECLDLEGAIRELWRLQGSQSTPSPCGKAAGRKLLLPGAGMAISWSTGINKAWINKARSVSGDWESWGKLFPQLGYWMSPFPALLPAWSLWYGFKMGDFGVVFYQSDTPKVFPSVLWG